MTDAPSPRCSSGNEELQSVYDALTQAQDCIRGETPEDVSDEEAREDTINKIREAMRTIEALMAPSDGAIYAAVSKRDNPGDTELMRGIDARLGHLAQAAPEGWKLVPTIPNQAMIEAGCDNNPTSWNEGTDDGFAADVANDVYVAMVRAAPSSVPSTTFGGAAK